MEGPNLQRRRPRNDQDCKPYSHDRRTPLMKFSTILILPTLFLATALPSLLAGPCRRQHHPRQRPNRNRARPSASALSKSETPKTAPSNYSPSSKASTSSGKTNAAAPSTGSTPPIPTVAATSSFILRKEKFSRSNPRVPASTLLRASLPSIPQALFAITTRDLPPILCSRLQPRTSATVPWFSGSTRRRASLSPWPTTRKSTNAISTR